MPAPNDRLRILAGADGRSFFVLDLLARTAAPIVASAGASVNVAAPNGRRAWMLAPHASVIAALNIESLHPVVLQHPVAAAFDVRRRDGGRALVAVHQQTPTLGSPCSRRRRSVAQN